MKKITTLLALSLLVLTSVVYAFADIARPKPTTSPEKEPKVVFHTGLTITPDEKSYEARLQIPESELNDFRQALASVQTANPTMMQRVAHSSPRTIVAGIFLFLSVSFAGVWLARAGQQRSHKVVAAIVLGAAVIGAATVIVRANAGPPPYYRWRGLPQALTEGRSTSGGLNIEIVAEGNGIKLILPLRNPKKPNGEE
ncbi:MAG TPA: hypothetical protein VN643_13695 [Pyrinomonadaceae bacterium]|nr:hypothetical protein [Pyrinomonadaceae bacterium]